MSVDERPTFLHDNHIYVSAGVIPFTLKNNKYYFLMQKQTGKEKKWLYEDFGGKSKPGDLSIKDVAFRECCEELNYKEPFTGEFLESCLTDQRSVIHKLPMCKYMLYLIYVNPDLMILDLSSFGSTNDDGIERVVEWISYKTLFDTENKQFHPRISSDFKDILPLLLAHDRASTPAFSS